MIRMSKQKLISIGMCVVLLTTGCSIGSGKQSDTENALQKMQEEVQDINYEVPKSSPNVLVDQMGYAMDSTKIAIFRGENLQNTFEVIDAASGETVYTGDIISQGYDDKLQEYVSYGSFTELEKKGTYYIQTAVIGQSYPFIIGDKLYNTLLPKIGKNIYYSRCGTDITAEDTAEEYVHSACHTKKVMEPNTKEELDLQGGWHTDNGHERNVEDGCAIATNLLLTYEFYAAESTDDAGIPESGNHIPDVLDEVKYEINWLLKMQNTKTGGVYSDIMDSVDISKAGAEKRSGKQQLSEITDAATAMTAGVLAQFCNDYRDYEPEYALICLGAAERAWKYLESSVSGEAEYTQEKYFAAAQLYKTTGNLKYHKYILQYHNTMKSSGIDTNKELYGDVAYLTTSKKVDTALCNRLMERWMNKAERIVEESKKSPYFVVGDTNEDMLNDMLCLAVVDHVITNHEYVTVLESHLHYLLGRNPEGVSFIEGIGKVHPEAGDKQIEITRQPELTSTLMFMLGEIIVESNSINEKSK